MGRIAFVMSGPQGGTVVDMDEEDFVQAEAEGWVIDFDSANRGGNPDPFAGFNTKPHPQAEAWLAKRGLYPTREMRPEQPGGRTEAAPKEPEAAPKEEPKPKAGDKPKPSPAKK